MKLFHYLLIAALMSLLLLSGAKGPDPIREFVAPLTGSWVADPLPGEGTEPLFIHIDPYAVEGQHIRIFVSRYCQEAVADYLLFELCEDHLAYFTGLLDGEFRDVSRIDFLYLRPVHREGEWWLEYEAEETEYSHYQFQRLHKLYPPMGMRKTDLFH